MPKLGLDVGFQGESGSRSDIAKLSRMTRSCHHNARWEAGVVVNHVHMPTSWSLTAQVRPKLDRSADRSRILTHIVDPGRIDDHVLSWEPIVVISQIVIDPIAIVVDVRSATFALQISFLLGRQLVFGQEPPINLRSTTAVRCPDLAMCQARYLPPSPLPRMSISKCSGGDIFN